MNLFAAQSYTSGNLQQTYDELIINLQGLQRVYSIRDGGDGRLPRCC